MVSTSASEPTDEPTTPTESPEDAAAAEEVNAPAEPTTGEPAGSTSEAPVVQPTPTAAEDSAPAAETTAADSKVVYVSAPPAPKKKSARGVGALVVILSAAIFAGVYAALILLLSLVAPPVSAGAMLQVFAAPIFWIPVIVFTLSYLLLVVIVNRAGWWAHVLGGFIVAVLVYVSFIGAALIMASAIGGTSAVVGAIVLSQLTNPLGFVAAVAAREVPIWVGGLVAKRGRTVAARNTEARAAYQRDLEAHRASVGANTAV